MNSTNKHRNIFSLQKKKDIIIKIEKTKQLGKSVRSVAKEEKISSSTIVKIWKNRTKILEWIEKNPNTAATVIDCYIN